MTPDELLRLQKEEIDSLRIRIGEILEPIMDISLRLEKLLAEQFSKPIHPIVLQVDALAERDAQAEEDAERNIEECKFKKLKQMAVKEAERIVKEET